MNNASFKALAMLHATDNRKTNLLSNAVFLAAIYVNSRYQALLKYFQKTVAQAYLAILWRHSQMLQESVDTTDVECPDLS